MPTTDKNRNGRHSHPQKDKGGQSQGDPRKKDASPAADSGDDKQGKARDGIDGNQANENN